jgi:predicted alpha/beta superfamily hydrolase
MNMNFQNKIMKYLKLSILALLFVNAINAQKIEKINVSGGKTLGNHEILIYTPVEYADLNRKFEVIYVLDAQSREFFDVVHSTLAFQTYGIRPMIVVGISSLNRNYDFLPENKFTETAQELSGQLGGASIFSDYIEQKLMPFIEKKYRVLPFKIGIGYSNGGTFLNNNLLTKPTMFDAIFSIDANITFDRGQLINSLNDNNNLIKSTMYYYTCQTLSGDKWVESANRFNALLESKIGMTIEKEVFKSETHQTVFQQAIINAFQRYFKYQFFNSEKLVNHFKSMEKLGGYVVKKEELHRIASIYLQFNLVEEARKLMLAFEHVLDSSIQDSDDLFAIFETGKLYFALGFRDIAKAYFIFCDAKIEQNKKNMSSEFYNFGKEKIKEQLNLFENSK